MNQRSRWRRRLRWALLMATGGAVLGVLGLWLALQHVPAWYHPVEIAPEHLQEVRNDLAATQGTLNEQMLLARAPFEFRISEEQINAWLSAREDIWPLSREWLPPGVSDPLVRILPDGLRLSATVRHGWMQAVVTVWLELGADPTRVYARLLDVRSGSLPLPHAWVRHRLAAIRPPSLRHDGQAAPVSLDGLFDGISQPNSGVWTQPAALGQKAVRRSFRVTALRLEAGAITVTIEPRP